jgi:hypothetical protein
MNPVIDPDLLAKIAELLREHAKIQNRLLVEVLQEYKRAQFEALEAALEAHLKAQHSMTEELLERLEALFRAPGEPKTERRLDS